MPIALASLALALVGAAIVAVVADSAAQLHPKYWIDDHTYEVSAADMSTIDRTFDLSHVKNVRIVTNSMDVYVVPAAGGGSTSAMRVTGRAPAQKVIVEFERAGDNATLTLHETGDWAFGAMGSKMTQPFTVALDEHRAIDIETASGDVTIDGSRGPLSVRSASGDVTLNDATDAIDVRTASGDATLSFPTKWAGAHATIGTMSGDVVLNVPRSDFRAALETSTASGDVTNDAKLPQSLPGAPVISARTMSGDISVR